MNSNPCGGATPDTLWLVLLRSPSGEQTCETWRAPHGRTGLRRIFRIRQSEFTATSAVPMSVITSSKIPNEKLSRLQKMMKGDWHVVFINTDDDIPGIVAIQSHTTQSAVKAAQERGHSTIAGVALSDVKEALGKMQGILHTVEGVGVDKDLVGSPPTHQNQKEIEQNSPSLVLEDIWWSG